MTYHLVNSGIILGYISKGKIEIIMLLHFIKAFADTRQHSQCKHIYLKNAKCIYIIFIPFDTCSVLHSCVEYGTQVRKLFLSNYKATCMLSKLSGETNILLC